nr:MAG TPA: hypothetical protein [Bacteriophage sp.]
MVFGQGINHASSGRTFWSHRYIDKACNLW